MELTITEMTNGTFYFNPSTGKKRSDSKPMAQQTDDNLTFVRGTGQVMYKDVPYGNITIIDASAATHDDFASAQAVVDKLRELGMN